MTSSPRFSALPSIPTADSPSDGIESGAQNAWQPNVITWMLVWRTLITIEFSILILSGVTKQSETKTLAATIAITLITGIFYLLSTRGKKSSFNSNKFLLTIDLASCLGLILITSNSATRSLVVAYTCSSIIAWASWKPINAFIVGVASITAFVFSNFFHAGYIANDSLGTVGLVIFFSLATSGFFTVAHRIGALEITAEVSRERGRYRRDLHDRLGQALSGMHFEVQAVEAVGFDKDASLRLRSLADGYRDAQKMLQDLLNVGDEPMVGTNVTSVIRQDARRMSQQAGVRIDVETSGDASKIPAWVRPHIVAISGECVNNAVKNGSAKGIDISIDVTDTLVVVSVTDDGIGFDNPPGTITVKEGHYGLREMAERARICGGEVVVASQVGFGTRVRLQVPLPDDAAQDILERDVSLLRGNVWSLILALRIILGAVAITQLSFWAVDHKEQFTWSLLLIGSIFLDLLVGVLASNKLRYLLTKSVIVSSVYFVFVGLWLSSAFFIKAPTSILIYAPLTLLFVGVSAGRRKALRQTLWMLVVVGIVGSTSMVMSFSDTRLQVLLVHITDIALIGIAAIQGAKLLDRLETLQIRVRYQAIARLRHGLSGKMREQLTERLKRLETHVRALSENPLNKDGFALETQKITAESTELKRQLREIVHTLAEPSA